MKKTTAAYKRKTGNYFYSSNTANVAVQMWFKAANGYALLAEELNHFFARMLGAAKQVVTIGWHHCSYIRLLYCLWLQVQVFINIEIVRGSHVDREDRQAMYMWRDTAMLLVTAHMEELGLQVLSLANHSLFVGWCVFSAPVITVSGNKAGEMESQWFMISNPTDWYVWSLFPRLMIEGSHDSSQQQRLESVKSKSWKRWCCCDLVILCSHMYC